MADKSKYGSSVAFTDLLFNIVVGLAFLFLLAFILMNPIAKEKDIESKSDFIIVMTWDDESGDDIDLWVRDPGGRIVSFRNRGTGFMHLDRDDLGLANDRIQGPDGKMIFVYRNKEVISLRGFSEGTYLVNAHVYNKKTWKDGKLHDSHIKIELIKLNPYKEVVQAKFIGTKTGQEFTAFHFTLDEDGKVIKLSDEREPLIGAKSVYEVNTNPTPDASMTQEETQRWVQGEGW